MSERFHPRGDTMRDSNDRAGFDRVLMAVAATFIAVASGSALVGSTAANAGPSTSNPADMAIDAAIPRPEPANVPPPTAADFKADTTASVPAATDKPATDKPADVATGANKPDAGKPDTAKVEPSS